MVKKALQLQDKAMRTINFKVNDHPADELYHFNEILKITDYIKLLNCMFVKTYQLEIPEATFKGPSNQQITWININFLKYLAVSS